MARQMAETGHSRPMHSVPVPINVRCYSNSDIIVRRNEATLRANNGSPALFDHFIGEQLHPIGYIDAKSVGCLKVDNQIEFGRLLDR
jgi:hypothetical protein